MANRWKMTTKRETNPEKWERIKREAKKKGEDPYVALHRYLVERNECPLCKMGYSRKLSSTKRALK